MATPDGAGWPARSAGPRAALRAMMSTPPSSWRGLTCPSQVDGLGRPVPADLIGQLLHVQQMHRVLPAGSLKSMP
jgi:hypothetical protein